jgi:hypothetical protein
MLHSLLSELLLQVGHGSIPVFKRVPQFLDPAQACCCHFSLLNSCFLFT